MAEEWEKDLQKELEDPEFAKNYGAECARSGFGLALLHAREEQGLTQKQLADKLGVKQPYIAQLESGEANPTLDMAGRILASLDLKVVISTAPLRQEFTAAATEPNTKHPAIVAEPKAKYHSVKRGRNRRV